MHQVIKFFERPLGLFVIICVLVLVGEYLFTHLIPQSIWLYVIAGTVYFVIILLSIIFILWGAVLGIYKLSKKTSWSKGVRAWQVMLSVSIILYVIFIILVIVSDLTFGFYWGSFFEVLKDNYSLPY